MTSKATRKRLAKVACVLGAMPVPPGLAKAAFETFKATGQLPEDIRVATAVVGRVRCGYDSTWCPDGTLNWGATIQSALAAMPRGKDDVMDELLNEAVNATGLVQAAARQVLMRLAAEGLDVTTTLFADESLPEFGTVGLAKIQFLERLVRRPYVRQGRRLIRRIERLQENLPLEREWFTELGRAVECFQIAGERPDDDLMLELILAFGELSALMNHACGEDVRDLMALFDAIAKASGSQRESLIGQLQARAYGGEFAPPEE
jgi:hypothetical protein